MIDTPPSREQSLLAAAWRYRWQVLATILLFAALGFAYGYFRPESWTTTASLVVRDPQGDQTAASSGDPERYLLDQAAILQSAEVADRAAQIVSESNPPLAPTTEEILDHREVTAGTGSNLITVGYEAADPNQAILVANAVVQAYQDIYRQETTSAYEGIIGDLDASVAAIDEELAGLREEIEAWTAADPDRAGLSQQYRAILARVVELEQPAQGASAAERAAYRAELNDILSTLQMLELVNGLQPDDPALVALLQDEQAALERRSQLAARRVELEIEAGMVSTGVTFFYPARFVEESGISLRQSILVGGAIGVLIALVGSYFATLRNWRFGRRDEPEGVLGAPLLAEVPDFTEEKGRSALPVRDAPASASAEAFRFAAATLSVRFAMAPGSSPRPPVEEQPRVLVVTSATLGEGKTVVTANTAMAAARGGSRVLVIDADLGRPALTRLMLRAVAPVRGLTDVVEKAIPLARAAVSCAVSETVHLDVLGRGTQHVNAADFFHSAGTRELLQMARSDYDLVLIDAPPILQEAYTSTLIGYADGVIVVVPHKSRVSLLEDEVQRLALIGTPAAGYVYNRAPLRQEMARYKTP